MSLFIGVLVIAGIVISLIYLGKKSNFSDAWTKREAEIDSENRNFIDKAFQTEAFMATHKYVAAASGGALAIDEKRRKICIYDEYRISNRPAKPYYYDLSDIIDVTIFVAEGKNVTELNTVTKASLSDAVGGAVVGKWLAGDGGMVVGGLTGKKTSTTNGTSVDTVRSITLRIRVTDKQTPEHNICCLYMEDSLDEHGIAKSTDYYATAIAAAQDWHSLLTHLRTENLKQQQMTNTVTAVPSKTLDLCVNCDRKIGRLEQAFVFKDNIVCSECYKRLLGSADCPSTS